MTDPVEPIEPNCPLTCPNRKSDVRAGKNASYGFALLCAAFLGWQCLSADRQGKELSPIIWMPCLVLIGTALGVNIDPGALGKFVK